EANDHDEPVIGFIRVQAAGFEMRAYDGVAALDTDFFVSRTLTTVQQYAAFVHAGGYLDDTLWDPVGVEWRKGRADRSIGEDEILTQRPVAMRQLPWRWADQVGAPTRPVVGITWYEARAYAAWLQIQLALRLSKTGLKTHRIRLPREPEWYRAAKAIDMQ